MRSGGLTDSRRRDAPLDRVPARTPRVRRHRAARQRGGASTPSHRASAPRGARCANNGAVSSSSATTRVTWNAVTSGTPSCSTFAVMHISAMPPGADPSTSVAGWQPRQLRKHPAEGRRRDDRAQHRRRRPRRRNAARRAQEIAARSARRARNPGDIAGVGRQRRHRRQIDFHRRQRDRHRQRAQHERVGQSQPLRHRARRAAVAVISSTQSPRVEASCVPGT